MSEEQNLRLQASEPISEDQGRPTLKYQNKWQKVIDKLEELEARIEALEP